MRNACQPEPKFLAVFTSLKARRFSVRTNIPGDIYQFECEAFFSQGRNSWRYFPVYMRGVYRPGPKFLPVFTSLNLRRLSVRTKVPGGIFLFLREAFFSQPKSLAVFPCFYERRFSVRTETPGGISQFKFEPFFGRGQNSWRFPPV